jgi:16S rRNA processing protein RimM
MAEQREPREGYVAVGRVLRPWGLRGEVKVQPLTDFPDRFEPGAELWAGGTRRTVERGRFHKGELYLKLAGFDTPEAAEAIRDELLEVPESDLHALEEGDFYHYQLEGLSVQTTAGEPLGSVREVLEPGGNAVLVVGGERGEILVPFIDDVIRNVNLAAGLIEVDLIEGLLPEERRRERRPTPYARRRAHRNPAPPS